MLLCFVDESFKGDFYAFSALIADQHATRELTLALNQLVDQVAVEWGISRQSEIHAYEIFHGVGAWDEIPARARVRVFEASLKAVIDADVRIYLRAVNSRRLAERQAHQNYPVNFPADQVCFQHILQRANGFAKRHGEYALVIADERNDRERHRERFALYQTDGTPGVYMHTTLDRLLDTVHFAPSHHSRMLQAADLLAFLYRRVQTVAESDPRQHALMQRLWGMVAVSGKLSDVGEWP